MSARESSKASCTFARNQPSWPAASGYGVDVCLSELICRRQNGYVIIFGACIMQAVTEIEAPAARAIAMRGGKSDPGSRVRRREIADFDSALIEELDDDRFYLRHGEAELVGAGKAEHRFKHGNRGCEGDLRGRDRIGDTLRFRLVGEERYDGAGIDEHQLSHSSS
ncbi:protein of unknown function (plasmid) [Shinella sp. WSC3-e]|nr:protein of unknown function [Shinella sp. WSC3-e]